MNALLVRIGVDQAYGGWNAPVDAEGRFVYVPIPEKLRTPFHNEEAWATLHSNTSRPFAKPKSGRIAVKVINHLGDEVMKVFRVI